VHEKQTSRQTDMGSKYNHDVMEKEDETTRRKVRVSEG
jgi:hypothetical protein